MKTMNINEMTRTQKNNLKKLGKILNPPRLELEVEHEKKMKKATWYRLDEYVKKYPEKFNIWTSKKGKKMFTVNSDKIKMQYDFDYARFYRISPDLNNEIEQWVYIEDTLNIKISTL